jgi:hypothetical protein
MKGLAWKVALLTAVVAVGFLVMLQAQRGMNQAMSKKAAEAQAATQPPTTPELGASTAMTDAPKADPFGEAAANHNSPGPNDAKVVPPLNTPEIAAKDAAKPPAGSPADEPKKTGAAIDPFADSNEAKNPVAADDAKNGPSPGRDIKQTSGSSDAGPKSPDAPGNPATGNSPAGPAFMTEPGGPKVPDAGGPALNGLGSSEAKQDSKSNESKPFDANEPPKQSEPPAASTNGPQIEPFPDLKPADSKPV